jgi:hypothetical protein
VREKLPLQKSSFFPATTSEKVLIAIDGAVMNGAKELVGV